MRIIQIAAEFAPIAKAGGLGEVLLGLTRELIQQHHSVEVLIPKYSFMRAAWGTLISEMILLGINWFNAHRIVSFKVDCATTLKIFLIFAITLVATLFIRQLPINFIIGIALSAITYLLLSQLFKVYDLKTFRELIKPTENQNG